MLFLLAESVASRMRELVSRCTVVEVYVRDTELNSFCRQRKLQAPTCSSSEIANVAFDLFRKNYHWDKPVRSIGVRGSGLVTADAGVQLSFYADAIKRDKWERIDAAVDELRERYGYMSVRRALTLSDPLLGAIYPKDDHTVHLMFTGGDVRWITWRCANVLDASILHCRKRDIIHSIKSADTF